MYFYGSTEDSIKPVQAGHITHNKATEEKSIKKYSFSRLDLYNILHFLACFSSSWPAEMPCK